MFLTASTTTRMSVWLRGLGSISHSPVLSGSCWDGMVDLFTMIRASPLKYPKMTRFFTLCLGDFAWDGLGLYGSPMRRCVLRWLEE